MDPSSRELLFKSLSRVKKPRLTCVGPSSRTNTPFDRSSYCLLYVFSRDLEVKLSATLQSEYLVANLGPLSTSMLQDLFTLRASFASLCSRLVAAEHNQELTASPPGGKYATSIIQRVVR